MGVWERGGGEGQVWKSPICKILKLEKGFMPLNLRDP